MPLIIQNVPFPKFDSRQVCRKIKDKSQVLSNLPTVQLFSWPAGPLANWPTERMQCRLANRPTGPGSRHIGLHVL